MPSRCGYCSGTDPFCAVYDIRSYFRCTHAECIVSNRGHAHEWSKRWCHAVDWDVCGICGTRTAMVNFHA